MNVETKGETLNFARRLVRAVDEDMKLEQSDSGFKIIAGEETYKVEVDDGWIRRCNCIDYSSRHEPCKHMLKVWMECDWADLEGVFVGRST